MSQQGYAGGFSIPQPHPAGGYPPQEQVYPPPHPQAFQPPSAPSYLSNDQHQQGPYPPSQANPQPTSNCPQTQVPAQDHQEPSHSHQETMRTANSNEGLAGDVTRFAQTALSS